MTARILVVEDDYIVAEDIAETLRELGFEVCEVAGDAPGALRAATTKQPDLVLMDIMLHGKMDGVMAAETIRRKSGERVPVLFLTAYADDPTLELAKRAEPAGFLIKPFRPRELNAAIHVALHTVRKRLGQTNETTAARQRPTTICAWCKRVQVATGQWQPLDHFVRDRYGLLLSHGMCETCLAQRFPEEMD